MFAAEVSIVIHSYCLSSTLLVHYDVVVARIYPRELDKYGHEVLSPCRHVQNQRVYLDVWWFWSSNCVSTISKLLTMHFFFLYAALWAPFALAFPWMTPEGMGNLLNHPEARQEINRRMEEHFGRRVPEQSQHRETRQLGTGLLDGVVTLLGGTLEAILDNVLGLIPTSDSVNGLRRFPEGMPHISILSDRLASFLY